MAGVPVYVFMRWRQSKASPFGRTAGDSRSRRCGCSRRSALWLRSDADTTRTAEAAGWRAISTPPLRCAGKSTADSGFPDAASRPRAYPRDMTRASPDSRPGRSTRTAVLASVVCGIDGSPEAAEAVRQAALLAPPEARIELVGVIHAGLVESVASVMPARTPEPERRLRKEAWAALARRRRRRPGRDRGDDDAAHRARRGAPRSRGRAPRGGA